MSTLWRSSTSTLSADEQKDEVDLGVYLSQIASAVMSFACSRGYSPRHEGGYISGVDQRRHACGTGRERTADQCS